MSFASIVSPPRQTKGKILFQPRTQPFKFAPEGVSDKVTFTGKPEKPFLSQHLIAQQPVVRFHRIAKDQDNGDDDNNDDDENIEDHQDDRDDSDEDNEDNDENGYYQAGEDDGDYQGGEDDEDRGESGDDEDDEDNEAEAAESDVSSRLRKAFAGIGTATAPGSGPCYAELKREVVVGRGRHPTVIDRHNFRSHKKALPDGARLSMDQSSQLRGPRNTCAVARLRERGYSTEKLEEDVKKKQTQIRILTETNDDLHKKLMATKALIEEKGKKVTSLDADIRRLVHELARMKLKVNTQARELQRIPELERQVVTLKKALGDAHALTRQVDANNKTLKREVASMKVTIEDKETRISSLNEEIERLQEDVALAKAEARKADMGEWEWDVLRHRVSKAEARMRVLDNVSRFKVQAKLESSFSEGTRSARSALLKETVAVKAKVREMNDKVNELSSAIVVLVEEAGWRGGRKSNSKASAGRSSTGRSVEISTVLGGIPTVGAGALRPGLLLLRVALEVFFVRWCVDVIEANYPDQRSFADFLIDVCHAQPRVGDSSGVQPSVTPATCIPPSKILPPPISPTSYASWTKDVMSELDSQVLEMVGLKFDPACGPGPIEYKISELLKMAHDLRLGLTEKQHLGGLELSVIGSGTPFRETFMDDAFADRDVTIWEVDGFRDWKNLVLGTTGLGLQRDLAFGQASVGAQGSDGCNFQKVEILVKPQVFVCR